MKWRKERKKGNTSTKVPIIAKNDAAEIIIYEYLKRIISILNIILL